MQLDDVLHDCQPESEAAVGARGAAVSLTEAFENVGEELARDARASVADDDACSAVGCFVDVNRDCAADRRELHRIREQIPDHLLQPVGIAESNAFDLADV